jgi:hypothetical protein
VDSFNTTSHAQQCLRIYSTGGIAICRKLACSVHFDMHLCSTVIIYINGAVRLLSSFVAGYIAT